MSQLSPFTIRIQEQELPLPVGDFQIGRNRACHLVLEDGMVSRRHAVLHVSPKEVVVEDLGSRNGVRVNGVPIVGPRAVGHGERIAVGNFEILLLERARRGRQERATRPLPTRPARERPSGGFEDETEVDPRSLFDLLLESCRKHMEEGDMDQVLASAANLRSSLRSGLVKGRTPALRAGRDLFAFAFQVLEQADNQLWLDVLLELYGNLDIVPDAETVDELVQRCEKGELPELDPLREYLKAISCQALKNDELERLARLDAVV